MRLLFLIFAVFLISCDRFNHSISSSALDPKVQFQKAVAPLRIEIMNKKNTDPLTISDEIIFSGFLKSGLFDLDKLETIKNKTAPVDSASNVVHRMDVSTRCISNGKKFIFDQSFSKYRFQFSVIELLPELLFLEEKESKISCSFFFSVKDKNSSSHYFSLTQIPMKNLHHNMYLSINSRDNEVLNLFSHNVVDNKDIDNFFLTHENSKNLNQIRFICTEWVQKIGFQSIQSATPIFRLLQSRDDLPVGEQKCRVVIEEQNMVSGITVPFLLDFSQFKEKAVSLDLKNIKLKTFDSMQSESLFYSQGKWDFWTHMVSVTKHTSQSLHELIHNDRSSLGSSFVFENLPKDFHHKSYRPVLVQIKTECGGGLFADEAYEQLYEFPLTSEFSAMSILPLDLLQIYYLPKKQLNTFYKKLKINQHFGDHLVTWLKEKSKNNSNDLSYITKASTSCSHKIKLKDVDGQELNFPVIYREIAWNSSGFGVSFDSKFLRAGYPVFINQIEGQLSFNFMREVSNYQKNLRDSQLPDRLTLMCGKDFNESPKVILDMKLEAPVLSVSTALLFRTSAFRELLHEKLLLKCRVLLYKDKIVKYFSPEIQIVSISSMQAFDDLQKALFGKRIVTKKGTNDDDVGQRLLDELYLL